MINDAVSSFHDGDSLVSSLAFVFNFPTGFNHLAHILDIDSIQWKVKSEVIFVLSKPISPVIEIDCGEIITPRIDSVEGVKYWTEIHLKKPWQEVISNIMQIQALQLKNYLNEMNLIKSAYSQNSNMMKPVVRQVYILEDKISKIKRASTLLHNVVAGPTQ
jgi:hypothetical protein